jgi:hypothetical protein
MRLEMAEPSRPELREFYEVAVRVTNRRDLRLFAQIVTLRGVKSDTCVG